jgi:hypothetical protein
MWSQRTTGVSTRAMVREAAGAITLVTSDRSEVSPTCVSVESFEQARVSIMPQVLEANLTGTNSRI